MQRLHLVDNGRVAFSNPVRQSLYTFTDCEGGGRLKAEAAMDALRRVCPGAQLACSTLSIPMPGHPPAAVEAEQVMQVRASRRCESGLGTCCSTQRCWQTLLLLSSPLWRLQAAKLTDS